MYSEGAVGEGGSKLAASVVSTALVGTKGLDHLFHSGERVLESKLNFRVIGYKK